MNIGLPTERIEKTRERWRAVWYLEETDRVVWVPPPPPTPKEEQVPFEKYFNLDPDGMLQVQLRNVKNQLKCPYGDYIPYLDSWFGVSVVSSAFGAEFRVTKGDTWTVPLVKDPSDIDNLKQPDPYRDGLMPRILKTLDYWRKRVGDKIPMSVTNTQSPLDDGLQIMGPANMMKAMYTQPDLVHKLLNLLTDTFIEWNIVQKEHIGQEIDESYCSAYGSWLPKGVGGIMISDDAAAYLSPRLYEKFIVPCNCRIFERFKGGVVHWCGDALHNYRNILKISQCRGIHNGTMDHLGVRGAKHPGRESLFEFRKLSKTHVIQFCLEHNPRIETMEEFWRETFNMFLPDGGIILLGAGFGPIEPLPETHREQVEIYMERVKMLSKIIEKYGRCR